MSRDLRKLLNWLAEMGEQRTVEDVKRDLKNKLRPFLNSLL